MDNTVEFERKKQQLKKKKRRARAKRRFVVFVFLFVCIGIIFTVLKAPVFNVKSIVCVGQDELTEEQIIKIAGAKTDVNIFSTGISAMKRRLAENPAIAECNVRRLFPNKIKIWVRESKPALAIRSGEGFLLADSNGKIIKIVEGKAAEIAESLAKLEEFEPATATLGGSIYKQDDVVHTKTAECVSILAELEMLDKITMISAADLSDIKLDYQDRLYIMLGTYDQMEYKLTFIKKVISESLSEYEKANLDYRGKNLYVGPRVDEDAPLPEEGQDTDPATEEQPQAEDAEGTKAAAEDEQVADNAEAETQQEE